jgi:anti-anti-sigma regulatory factor
MHRIIYLSSAINYFSDDELKNLLRNSKQKNNVIGITGLLLYIDGDFLQVLEGEKKTVLQLYQKIKLDPRHKSIIKVFDESVLDRQFENWDMGFSALKYHDIQKYKEFQNITKESLSNINDKIASIFIDTFVKSHRNQIVYL